MSNNTHHTKASAGTVGNSYLEGDFPVMADYPLQTGIKNTILRSHSKPVTKITKNIRKFCAILNEKMYEYEGVGLAAPQIGVLKRIISVSFWEEKAIKSIKPSPQKQNTYEETQSSGDVVSTEKTKLIYKGDAVMINPEIKEKSTETFVSEEGCLSVPGKTGCVLRHRHIKVARRGPDGKEYVKKFSDYTASIIQHEIDHLNGILFVDDLIGKGEKDM